MAVDFAIDPNTGEQVPVTDSRYPVLSLYYRLLPQYQTDQQKQADYYINHTWHDWAVNVLLTGNKTAEPQPPNVLKLVLTKQYTLQTQLIAACDTPAYPDSTKFTVQVDPISNTYKIVPLTATASSNGAIAANVGTSFNLTNQDQVVAYLKTLSPTDLNNLIAKVLS